MKPNGRRRWRKWAKKNGAGRGDFADYRRFRRHSETTYRDMEGMRPGVAPSRPFTPRSLVGMSQQTRRWYARVDLILLHSTKQATNRTEGRALLLQWATLLKQPEARECYRRLLIDWRIGQRLRPCPGCTACLLCVACENVRCKRGHLRNEHCDGSGVIPARPRVNQGKPLAVEPADDLG